MLDPCGGGEGVHSTLTTLGNVPTTRGLSLAISTHAPSHRQNLHNVSYCCHACFTSDVSQNCFGNEGAVSVCIAVLYITVLCIDVLCCAVYRCVVHHCAVHHYAVHRCAVHRCASLCCASMCCASLCCAVLCIAMQRYASL